MQTNQIPKSTIMNVSKNHRAKDSYHGIFLLVTGTIFPRPAQLAQLTLTVNSVVDSSDLKVGDGSCQTGERLQINGKLEEECTLRAALEEANQASGEVIIDFSAGIQVDSEGLSMTIPHSPLPIISSQVTITGETHPLYQINGDYRNYNRPLSPISVVSGAVSGWCLTPIATRSGSDPGSGPGQVSPDSALSLPIGRESDPDFAGLGSGAGRTTPSRARA